MGYLLVDHRGGDGPDGKKGIKVEYDTVACRHCRAVIRILIRGVAGQKEYETPYTCGKCAGPICRFCAEHRNGLNECQPILRVVELALAQPRRRRGRLRGVPSC